MAEQFTLEILLKADGSGLVGEIKGADGALNKFKASQDKAGGSARKLARDTGKIAPKVKKSTSAMTNFGRTAAAIQGPLGGVAGRISSIGALAGSVGVKMAALGIAISGLTFFAFKSVKAFAELERQQLRTAALIKSTGAAAGFSAQQINEFAEQLDLSTLTSAKAARDAAGILLTFKSITGEQFKDTLRLSQDLAAVMGTDLRGAALQLGKALEEPEVGLTALRRSGVSFTTAEKALIKALTDSGQAAKAQRVILATLQKQIGGAGTAEAGGLSGAVDTLAFQWNKLKETVGSGFLGSGAKSLVNGLSSTVRFLRSGLREFDDLGDLIGAQTAFAVARISGEKEVAQRISALRKKARAELDGTAKATTKSTSEIAKGLNTVTDSAAKAAEALVKMGNASTAALSPAVKAVDKLADALRSTAERQAQLRKLVFETTGGAARGFFGDQIVALKAQASDLLKARIAESDVTDFVVKKLTELQAQASASGEANLAKLIGEVAGRNSDRTLNLVRDLSAEIERSGTLSDDLASNFADAQREIGKAGDTLAKFLPPDQAAEIGARVAQINSQLANMATSANVDMHFEIEAALSEVQTISARLADIPREIVTIHRIITINEAAASGVAGGSPAGSRATGGGITRPGLYQLEAGERIVRNTNHFGGINISMTGGLPNSPGALRRWVRGELIPELNAALR